MRVSLTVLAVAAAGLIAAACATEDASDRNERIVLAMIEAVNERDFDALDSLVAADMRRHSAATPDVKVESLELPTSVFILCVVHYSFPKKSRTHRSVVYICPIRFFARKCTFSPE